MLATLHLRAFHVIRTGTLSIMAAALIAGCGGGEGGPPGGPGGPLEVNVLKITPAPATLTQDLPGRTSAFRVAEVRARVNGIVLKRLFTEGADVQQGQDLYEIDAAPYQAALDSALGMLARANAATAAARSREERYKELVATDAVSKQDYDDALGSRRTFEADVLFAQAAVQTARINLGYTKVTSPIAGRIGLSQVTEGAYVQESAATLLATVQQLDRIYVDVTQASSEHLRLKSELANGRLKADADGQARVSLILEDGSVYPDEGMLEVSDVTVDLATNSVMVRALFPNPRGELLPGLFVRARLEEGRSPDAILVPQQAVTRNSKGEPTTLVVGRNGTAELRVLRISRAVGAQWLVTAGLEPGDEVIQDNLQRIRPGTPVKVAAGAPLQPNAGASAGN